MPFPTLNEDIPAERNRTSFEMVEKSNRYLGGLDDQKNRYRQERYWDPWKYTDTFDDIEVPLALQIVRFSANRVGGRELFVSAENPVVETWLQRMMRDTNLHPTLIRGLMYGAAYGGFYMKPDIDDFGMPYMRVVRPDLADPEWIAGRLRAVTFRTPLRMLDNDKNYWNLYEYHREVPVTQITDDGTEEIVVDVVGNAMTQIVIDYALYKSKSEQQAGTRVDIREHPDTMVYGELPTQHLIYRRVLEGFERIVAEYVPNNTNKFDRMILNEGASDLEGIYDLLYLINLSWATTGDEIDKGRPRLMVSQQLAESGNTRIGGWFSNRFGRGAGFDSSNSLIFEVPGPVSDIGDGKGIEQIMWQLQLDDRIQAVNQMRLWAIEIAGWSPQSFSLETEGGGDSGAAKEYREQATRETVEQKRSLLVEPLRRMLSNLIRLQGLPETEITVRFPAQNVLSDTERVEVMVKLWASGVVTLEDAVAYWNPNLGPDEIKIKAEEIRKEQQTRMDMQAAMELKIVPDNGNNRTEMASG